MSQILSAAGERALPDRVAVVVEDEAGILRQGQPIVAGEGRRLFDAVSLPERLQLKLVESKIFRSGCVALRYVKQ